MITPFFTVILISGYIVVLNSQYKNMKIIFLINNNVGWVMHYYRGNASKLQDACTRYKKSEKEVKHKNSKAVK